jgi:predicted metal-dependent phosphoesterase TrpH
MVKADLHIHTTFSEYPTSDKEPFKFIGIQDCYVHPEEAYKAAKKKGMDFVGITDHHSIEAALDLDSKYPDIIVGEELDVKASDDGHIIHLLVYDINEKQHNDLSDLRNIGVKETCEYTRKNDIIHSWAHPNLNPVKAALSKRLIDELMNYIDRIEVKNGLDTRIGNNFTKNIAKNYSKKISGGSDAHTKSFIGDVFTHNNSVRNKTDFLEAFKEGDVEVSGLDMNLYRWQKAIYVFAYQSLIKDIFLNPHKRDRENYKKYFLDQFLALTAFSPLLITVLPSIIIFYFNALIRDRQTSRLHYELNMAES